MGVHMYLCYSQILHVRWEHLMLMLRCRGRYPGQESYMNTSPRLLLPTAANAGKADAATEAELTVDFASICQTSSRNSVLRNGRRAYN